MLSVRDKSGQKASSAASSFLGSILPPLLCYSPSYRRPVVEGLAGGIADGDWRLAFKEIIDRG